MKKAHRLIAGAALAGATYASLMPAFAQTAPAPSAATPSTAAAAAAGSAMTEGEVRKVDKDTKKITLKHGEIKNLGMPPMTMVFQVSDPAMLEKVKTGDKVRFKATGEGGKYTVTQIEPSK